MQKKLLLICIVSFWIQLAIGQNTAKVYFDFNQFNLQKESEDLLSQWDKKFPDTEILEISGFCDSLGTQEYNLKLAERRIFTVLNVLQKSRITILENFKTKIIGENFKQNPIQSENRNVTIVYQKKGNAFEIGKKIKLDKLHFYGNSDVVLTKSQYVLKNLLDIMISNPTLIIDIQGHICCEEIDYNDISSKRAKAVYEFLLKNGISKDRISHQGFGSSSPIHPLPEHTEEERVTNRRVEIEIIKL